MDLKANFKNLEENKKKVKQEVTKSPSKRSTYNLKLTTIEKIEALQIDFMIKNHEKISLSSVIEKAVDELFESREVTLKKK